MEEAESDSEVPTKELLTLENQDPNGEEEDFENFMRDVAQRRRSSTTATVQPDKKSREDRKHHHRRHRKGEDTGGTSEKVKVIVRCRPLSEKERLQGHSKIIQILDNRKAIEVHRPNPSSGNIVNAKVDKVFTFDSVYDERTTQGELYEEAFSDLVDSVLEGFNGTIFAYGQTGTGKTYTMEGVREIKEEQGVIPNAFRHIFDRIQDSPDMTYLVRASYLEIYQEEVKDLLSPKLKICELKENSDGVYIKGLSSFLCRDFAEINKLMSRGNTHRAIGATNMNEHSSRSHAVFMIAVEMSETWADGESHIKVGRLNLVDLAGSERQGKTGAEGERLKEAVKINLSLSALGNVIGALADGKNGHIPYRDSKLTRLLQDSLGGNSRTIMVATVGPASFNYDETMVTLRYASRAKRIKNKPKINEDPKDAMLRNYQVEIAKLRALLDAKLGQSRSSLDEESGGESGRIRTARKFVSPIFDPSLVKELEPYLDGMADLQNNPKGILKILEEKRTALLSDTVTVTEEKERLIGKLESTQRKVEQAESDCGQLHDRIEWLESKVLNGGKTLLDQTNEQQRQIEERQRELDEEKVKEDAMRVRIQEHDLSVVELREIQGTLETSVGFDSKRLRKLQGKVFQARKDREERAQKYGFDVAKLQRYLVRNHKEDEMNLGILENFVPARMSRLLDSLAQHNPTDDTFSFMPMTSVVLPRPLVNRMTLLPLFNKAGPQIQFFPRENLYYVDENIIQLHPIPPRKDVKHYVPPDTDPHIKSVMTRALAEAEKEVAIDCHRINLTASKRRVKTARVRLGEILTFENNVSVRQVLSAKHRSREIPYRDFVAVMRVERGQSSIPFKNQLRRANHVSLSPNFCPVPPPSAFTSPLARNKQIPTSDHHNSNGNFPGSRPLRLSEKETDHSVTKSPFDPQHLEGSPQERHSESTNAISLRKLQEVLEKRKILANLQQLVKPSLAEDSRCSWTDSIYSETPPCTAIPQPGYARRPTSSQFSNIPTTPHALNEPKLFGSINASASSKNPKFREARHFGAGDLPRDPSTARTNSYPSGGTNPNRTESSRSFMERPMGTNYLQRDTWEQLDPNCRRKSFGFASTPSVAGIGGLESSCVPKLSSRRPSAAPHFSNLRGLGYSSKFSTLSSSPIHF